MAFSLANLNVFGLINLNNFYLTINFKPELKIVALFPYCIDLLIS